jgi:hypothetical protein
MLTKTTLVVALCGIGATVTLAQDEARIFQYAPIARVVGEGQYRAEVWRRENASGKEERAWSSSDLHGSSQEAIAAACIKLRESFATSCTQTSRDARAGETVKEPRPPKENEPKMPPANSPVPAPKAVAAPSNSGSNSWAKEFWVKVVAAASQPGSNNPNWAKEFWANQSKWSGGGDGGGGGGGGGCP